MTQRISKKIVSSALTFALLGLAIAACGDDGGESSSGGGGTGGTGGTGATGGSGGTGDSTNHSDQYADALCGKLFGCCDSADLVEQIGESVVDYAGCRILYRTLWDGGFEPTFADGQESGRLGFDEAAFKACIDAMNTQTCAEFAADGPVSCADIYVPKVEKGGACSIDVECKTKKCDVPAGAAEGTCVDAPAPAAEGQPCTENNDCIEGLYCDNVTDVCAKKRADGEACNRNDQCLSTCIGEQGGAMGSCGKLCEGGGPGPGPVDAVLETTGAPFVVAECDRVFDCCTQDERGAVLFPGLDTEAECRTFLSVFMGLGLAEVHNDVVAGRVALDAAKLSACVDAFVGIGCADYTQDTKFECPDGLKGLVADGMACGEDRQCSSAFCDKMPGDDMGTCAALPGAGAPCTTSCAEGYLCEALTCVAKKPIGAACTASSQCAEGRCYAEPMGMETCALICDGM